MSLFAAFIIITLIWSRLIHYGYSNGARVPTLWIVLGPLGQSITAAGVLEAQAQLAVCALLASAMGVFAILYGVSVWGFAMLWAVPATALTFRTMRKKLPFSLTRWSFTFPIGVTITGTVRLALRTGPSRHFDGRVRLGTWRCSRGWWSRLERHTRRCVGDFSYPPLRGRTPRRC